MTAKPAKPKFKKLSRGQRTHVRRVKEDARRSGSVYRAPFSVTRLIVPAKKDGAPS
jgi:hypothetical protein